MRYYECDAILARMGLYLCVFRFEEREPVKYYIRGHLSAFVDYIFDQNPLLFPRYIVGIKLSPIIINFLIIMYMTQRDHGGLLSLYGRPVSSQMNGKYFDWRSFEVRRRLFEGRYLRCSKCGSLRQDGFIAICFVFLFRGALIVIIDCEFCS